MRIIPNARYIVTGGTGFLGTPLIARIISEGGIVRTIARGEGKLVELKTMYGDSVEIVPGDIANDFAVAELMACDFKGVFHLAAFKHVPLAETHVMECLSSNVTGSWNILDCAVDKSPQFIIGISTDKAAQVAGVYGATKLLMEKMFVEYERVFNNPTIFRIVRYGNVLYSTGSVLCKWKELIQQGREVTVTCKEATRFFWTVDQALDLIFDCLDNAKDSRPYVPMMKAMSIGDLLEAMICKYASTDIKVNVIGLQKGENMHERIVEDGPFSNQVERFTIPEIMKLI